MNKQEIKELYTEWDEYVRLLREKKPAIVPLTFPNWLDNKSITAQDDKNSNSRFWDKVDKSGDCWEWLAYKNDKGYGRFSFDGKFTMAHRVSWAIRNGEIPDGLLVLHRCDNPGCVNPDHLFLGTAKDNALDSVAKGRWGDKSGQNNGQSKLTEKEVDLIRKIYAEIEITQEKLAEIFNVGSSTIGDIVRGENWKLPTPPAGGHR